jgi:hypothetical protein
VRPVSQPISVRQRLPQFVCTSATVALLALAWVAAAWRPLWYDELFTYHVATQPSALATLRALLAGADTNPPLDYLLRHATTTLLGDSAAAFRLPSALAFLAGLFAVYAYVRPRVPAAAAVAAFLAPIGTAAVFFAYEGRAYALLFASGAVALLAWQRAVAAPSRGRLALLVCALCLGPFSHYFGVLSVVPPACGEAWRSVARRKLDARIVAAFAAAGLASLLLLPFARNAMAMRSAFWASRFSLADAYQYFTGFLRYAGSPVVGVLCAALLALAVLAAHPRWRATIRLDVPGHEVAGATVLAYVPILAYALASVAAGALTPRYTIAFVPGLAILLGYLLAMVAGAFARSAWMASVAIVALGFGSLVAETRHLLDDEGMPSTLLQAVERSSLPVAFDSPHQFLEYSFYAPVGVRDRFVYPMDAELAARLRGFNNDELALRGLARVAPLQVTSYLEFAAHTPEFLLVRDYNFVAALARQLPVDGFCLDEVTQAGSVVLLHVVWGCRQ